MYIHTCLLYSLDGSTCFNFIISYFEVGSKK